MRKQDPARVENGQRDSSSVFSQEQSFLSVVEDIAVAVTSASTTGEGIHACWVDPEGSDTASVCSELAPGTLSPASLVTLLASGDEDIEHEKLFIALPSPSNPRAAASKKVTVTPVTTNIPARLIYDGTDTDGTPMFGQPIVVATSATGQGTHTRWLYPATAGSNLSSHSESSSEDADDEAVSESDFVSDCSAEQRRKLTIILPPSIKSLKRSRTVDDEDNPGRRTRSRTSASLSSVSSS
ncbi:hypothetical protein C0991_001337 [Blastosporella zonata]|nr:hypothetical protein C0991_001337 [Blastosporella zonata]